jgi:glycosyltransferase involved in cell wall biosynthesis
MIKLLGLALYGPKAASTRYRLGQYVPGLAQHGIDLQIRHLLDDDYLRRRFSGSPISWTNLLKAGWNRLGDLRNQEGFDAAILHCELLPLMPGWVERSLLPRSYIYDFDDAFYLKYRSGKLGVMRPFLGDKFDTVIAGAAAVTAGNTTLATYARRLNSSTHLLPTVVDTVRYVPTPRPSNDIFTVGWIGSPSTAPYLSELIGPLSTIGKESPVRLVVIGGKAPSIPNVSVVEVDWHEQTEVELINSFDVGVMPLPDDDWARGKCAFKLIQYMACAVPVIASRVGANIDVVQSDCGFLATDERDWVRALRLLRDQPPTRQQMGAAGRKKVEQEYSLQVTGPKLAGLIKSVVGAGKM